MDIRPTDNIYTARGHRVRWPYSTLIYNSTLANVTKGDNIFSSPLGNLRFIVPPSARAYTTCMIELRVQCATAGQNTVTSNQVMLTTKPLALEFGSVSPASEPLRINGQPFVELMAIDNFGIARKYITLDAVESIEIVNARGSYSYNFSDFAANAFISLSPAAMVAAFSIQLIFEGYYTGELPI